MPAAAILAENLTRRYGRTTALDGVSFAVGREEVVGFLGPNGAGKTTTMRILTGFLAATSGRAVVGGVDVTRNPVALRQQIGYLPEIVAFHDELRVGEYLDYRARVKQIGRRAVRRERIGRMMEQCGLADVRRRLVGQLSKGYRQRVGLADALLADPPILVLDEPTVGLDPQSIAQVRQMIRELGRRRTVLLSSHILPEVEAICPRVIIIARGRIVAEGTPEELKRRLPGANRVTAEIRGAAPRQIEERLGRLPGVEQVRTEPAGEELQRVWLLGAPGAERLREGVFEAAREVGWSLRELRRDTPGLEEIFLELTQGRLPAHQPAALPPPVDPPPPARYSALAGLGTQLRRELSAYFLTPTAWIVMTVFLFVSGASFAGFAGATYVNVPVVTQYFFGHLFYWFLMLFLPPIITMRCFAEERKSGRLELLCTAPGSDAGLLLAKYLAAFALFASLWTLTIGYFVALDRLASSAAAPHPVDWGPVAAGYAGTLATGAMFLALGMLTSVLSRDQLVAAVLGMICAVSLFGAGYLLPHTLPHPEWREAAQAFSLFDQHMGHYARGRVDTRHLVATASATVALLAISLRLLETRRWR